MVEWRDVVGFEGLYQVSRSGEVRSVDRVVSPVKHGEFGHLGVNLSNGAVRRKVAVHRIVLEAWVGPCPDGCEACHDDGDPTNNHVSNLRWDTPSNNGRDKRKHGTHGGCRVRRSDGAEFINMHVAAEETGCNYQHIWSVCTGRRKTTGGYGWEYCA